MKAFERPLDLDRPVEIDGETLDMGDVVAVARHRRRVEISGNARCRIVRCRAMVEVILDAGARVYGLTTGFGWLRDVAIAREDTAQLQKNLLMSHATGVGKPFAEDVVRAAILLRANTLCRGNSGVRAEVVERLVALLNDDVYPLVPQKGSVGCSGDLAPLSHLALVLIGHPAGRFYPQHRRRGEGWIVRSAEEEFVTMPPIEDAEAVERTAAAEGWKGFRPLELQAKEGLAINNGTQFMTAVGALTVYDSYWALRSAELAGALSLEAQRGVRDAYDQRLHAVRPQSHQGEVARRVMAYCEDSQIIDLYLNSAHLERAWVALEEGREILRGRATGGEGPGRDVLDSLAEAVDGLLGELERLIPREEGGYADEGWIAQHLGSPPREQIEFFQGYLAPLRRRVAELLDRLEDSVWQRHEVLVRVRRSAFSALEQIDRAVPEVPLVQDDYSFRCFPQVLSCAWRALEHVGEVIGCEINSANDNPLLFPPEPEEGFPDDAEEYGEWLHQPENLRRCLAGVLGGGNFHGEPIAIAMDYLTIAMAEVANISERRVAHLVNEHESRGLPPFLIEKSGLNSGLMMPQYTAAALVSENKVLAHPASVDSIPTSANSEDHVSMGLHAARKAAEVVGNVLEVLSIELLTAYQALGFRCPLAPGKPLRRAVEVIEQAGVERYEEDRAIYEDLRRLRRLLDGELRSCLI